MNIYVYIQYFQQSCYILGIGMGLQITADQRARFSLRSTCCISYYWLAMGVCIFYLRVHWLKTGPHTTFLKQQTTCFVFWLWCDNNHVMKNSSRHNWRKTVCTVHTTDMMTGDDNVIEPCKKSCSKYLNEKKLNT